MDIGKILRQLYQQKEIEIIEAELCPVMGYLKGKYGDFKADRPNRKLVTDISYIKTQQGTLYLSVIRDLYDNAMAENFFSILKTECIYRTKLKTYEDDCLLISEYIYFHNNERM